MCHLLGHIHQQLAIRLVNSAEQTPETAQHSCFFSGIPPGDIVRALPLGQIGKFGRLFTVVEELVERHFHRSCQLLEGLDRRNGVPVLDA